MPADQVIKYETALKVDKFVFMAHGSDEEADKARAVLARSKLLETA